MFNRQIADDIAAADEIVGVAVARSRVPGNDVSRGNAAGAYASATSTLVDSPGGAAGVRADGTKYYPFLLDVDSLDSTEARLG